MLLQQAGGLIGGQAHRDAKLQAVCELLRHGVDYGRWAGFYPVSTRRDGVVLGPFLGQRTERAMVP